MRWLWLGGLAIASVASALIGLGAMAAHDVAGALFYTAVGLALAVCFGAEATEP